MEWTIPLRLAPSGPPRPVLLSVAVSLSLPFFFGSVSARLVFPTNSFLSPASPFPTQWLPRVGSPLFLRYYEGAKTSGCSSHRSSFSFERRLPSPLHFFRSLRVLELLPLRQGVGLPVSPHRSGSFFRRKPVGSLKFPGYPFVLLPCSRTPVGSPRLAFCGASMLPPRFRLRRLQR